MKGKFAMNCSTGAIVSILAAAFLAASCSNAPPQPVAKKAPAAAQPVRITMFYATSTHPARDEKDSLCYGVENADQVSIEPAVDRVWPANSRCFDIPSTSATYTLTAMHGPDKVSQSVTISAVSPKP